MKTKTCVKCNETKAYSYFYKSKNTKDGFDYYCKHCRIGTALKSHRGGVYKKKCSVDDCERNHYAKTYCRVHYTRMFRNGTTDVLNPGNRKKYGRNSAEAMRRGYLKLKYKITPEQYNEMAKDGCEICGNKGLPHKKLHIDHDHSCCPVNYDKKGRTGYFKTCGRCVRGILCDACNQAVGRYENGKMRDDYPLRDKVIMYVAKYTWLISDRMVAYEKEQRDRKR